MIPDALAALVCGYATHTQAKKVVVMMQPVDVRYVSYTDESGGQEAGRILLLSSLILTYPEWQAFTDDWYIALREEPAIAAFHMREARGKEGNFKNWKAIEVDRKVIALTEVILKHKPHIVSCWLSEDDYLATIRATGPHDLRHAYFSAFTATVIKVAQYQAYRGIEVPADYIFDDKEDIGYEASLWYPAMKESQTKELQKLMGSTPVFRSDDDVLPLQAADLAAWHKRRRKEFPGLDTEAAASMRIDELPGAECRITRDALDSMAQKIANVPNVGDFKNGPGIYKQLKRDLRKGKFAVQPMDEGDDKK